jgi:hypothetical protein
LSAQGIEQPISELRHESLSQRLPSGSEVALMLNAASTLLEIFEDPVAVRSGSPKTNEHPQEMCGPTRKPPLEYGLRRQSIVFRVTKRSANGLEYADLGNCPERPAGKSADDTSR